MSVHIKTLSPWWKLQWCHDRWLMGYWVNRNATSLTKITLQSSCIKGGSLLLQVWSFEWLAFPLVKQHSTSSQTTPVQHQAAAAWNSNLLEGSFWTRYPANLQLLSAAPSVPFTWQHKKLVGVFKVVMLGLLLNYVVLICQTKRLSLLGAPITI